MDKYYMAYDERYKKIHDEGLMWFSNSPTPELLEWAKHYNIPAKEDICEVGCGEGRNALYLCSEGYRVTAIDASEAAIKKCRELSENKGFNINWQRADALFLNESVTKKYKWVYSIATLHMLVEDDDRSKFLSSLYGILEPHGKLLLVNMGDGKNERKTDISEAFSMQERTHAATGTRIMVAGTSNRWVNWEHHKQELERAGFIIEKILSTENQEYGNCMTVYLSKE